MGILDRFRKKNDKEKERDEEEEFNYCLNLVKDKIKEQLNVILVESLRLASERPPIWWQWLMLFIMGLLAGMGVGVVVANYLMPKAQAVIVPHG